MRPVGIEMPPMSPAIAAYLRLFNTNAPTPELQKEREVFRVEFGQTVAKWMQHFAEADKALLEQLTWERGEVVTQAKSVLAKMNEQQRANGLRSATQTKLQADLDVARQRLNEFQPINRTISSLEAIEQDQAKHDELRRAVADAQQAQRDNAFNLEMGIRNAQQLDREYRQLQAREESISRQIEELRKPPEQRKQHSSIVWKGADGSVFQAMRPAS